MSEQFYNKVLGLFFRFSLLLLLLVADMEVLFWYIVARSLLLYTFWLGLLMVSVLYGLRLYGNFDEFRINLGLFMQNNERGDEKIEPLNMEFNDKAVQVCLYYRNGASLTQIKENMGFDHAEQVRRHLLKGLDILLKNYENKQEDVKT